MYYVMAIKKKASSAPVSARKQVVPAPAKKAPAKKTVAVKKPVAAQKTAAAKPAKSAGKTAAAKSVAPAAPVTAVLARIDIGWGNRLYLRGSGAGLSWDVGLPMECSKDDEWYWKTTKAKETVTFKFLKNDERWATGEDLTVEPGKTSVSSPQF